MIGSPGRQLAKGDTVHIWSQDGQTYRGDARITSVNDQEIRFQGKLPLGTVKGDVLMFDAEYQAMMERKQLERPHPKIETTVPRDYFGTDAKEIE